MENRIADLKHDLGTDGFYLKEFFATEAAFRAALLLFTFLAEFNELLDCRTTPALFRTTLRSLRWRQTSTGCRVNACDMLRSQHP